MDVYHNISSLLQDSLSAVGLECHPFKVGWYNQHVKGCFHIDSPEDSLAFVVISTPSYFEKYFIPYICRSSEVNFKHQDLLDQSIKECLLTVVGNLAKKNVSILYDYEMTPGTRRPKVLVQTAGHVSGAVYFYQKDHVENPPWPKDMAIHGVCLHPKYTGWFAIRAVIIFHDVLVPDLPQRLPKDVIGDRNGVIEVLNRYNTNWQDWSFRDVVQPIERYSDLQKQYFSTKPAERMTLINSIRSTYL